MLLWCDVETTGLHVERDLLLEVAFVLTDDDLKVLSVAQHVLVRALSWRPYEFGYADPFVQKMHTDNNLWNEVYSVASNEYTGDGVNAFENDVYRMVAHYAGASGLKKIPLAGSTVSFDRSFLKKWMSSLEGSISYRNVDVSSFKEMLSRWNPAIVADRPKDPKAHRALPDCMASIAELRHYRDALGYDPKDPFVSGTVAT